MKRSFFDLPFFHLLRLRFVTIARQPEVLFWSFAMPVLIAGGLGLAFSGAGGEKPLTVVVIEAPENPVEATVRALEADPELRVRVAGREEALRLLRASEVSLVIAPGPLNVLHLDPSREDCRLARLLSVAALERAAGTPRQVQLRVEELTTPGSRYVDFLVPGLIAYVVMTSTLTHLGSTLVELRQKKLLRRLVATPMRRRTFLLAFGTSQGLQTLAETLFLIGAMVLLFDVHLAGGLSAVLVLAVLGAVSFGGLGLLTASRLETAEAANGLINIVALPLIVVSGVFFSVSHFPAWLQGVVNALPLGALVTSLRGVMMEGKTLYEVGSQCLVLLAWGILSFLLATLLFRWK